MYVMHSLKLDIQKRQTDKKIFSGLWYDLVMHLDKRPSLLKVIVLSVHKTTKFRLVLKSADQNKMWLKNLNFDFEK